VHPLLAPEDPQDDPDHFGNTRSHGEEHMFGSLMASINSPVMLAECLLHEMAHHKLRAFGVSFESATRLVANAPDELYASPLRKDQPRPMTAVLHAAYALTYMTELDLRIIDREPGGTRMPKLLRRLGTNLGRLEEGWVVLQTSLRPDREGEAFAAPYHAWIADIVDRGRHVLDRSRVVSV
jgi:HEXXH motif-containing protein